MKREDSGLSVFYRENKRVFAFDSNNEPVAEVMDGEIVIDSVNNLSQIYFQPPAYHR